MADEIYNSSFTGAQIDEAISDVRTNKETWNNAATKADDNATAISTLGTSTENRFTELEADISNNATDISNLSSTVSSHTTDISALQLGVQANQTALDKKVETSTYEADMAEMASTEYVDNSIQTAIGNAIAASY